MLDMTDDKIVIDQLHYLRLVWPVRHHDSLALIASNTDRQVVAPLQNRPETTIVSVPPSARRAPLIRSVRQAALLRRQSAAGSSTKAPPDVPRWMQWGHMRAAHGTSHAEKSVAICIVARQATEHDGSSVATSCGDDALHIV